MRVAVVGRLPLHVLTGERPEVDEVSAAIRDNGVHRVILAPGSGETDDMLDAIRLVKALGVRVSVLPRVLEVVGSSVEFDDVNGVPVLGVRSFGLSRSSMRVKRVDRRHRRHRRARRGRADHLPHRTGAARVLDGPHPLPPGPGWGGTAAGSTS